MGKFDQVGVKALKNLKRTDDEVLGLESGQEHIIPLSQIHATWSFTWDGKPLRHYYDEAAIHSWAEHELKENGIRSPLWIRPMPADVLEGRPRKEPQYELVAGMRRFMGAQYLKLKTVPVKIFHWDNDEAYQAAAEENFNRRDFTPLEELDSTLLILAIALDLREEEEVVQVLYKMKNAMAKNIKDDILLSDQAKIVEEVFKRLNRMTWQSFITTRLSLRKKPEDVLDAIREGKLDYSKAMPIASLQQPQARNRILKMTIEQNWTVKQVREQVARAKNKNKVKPTIPASLPERFTFLGRQMNRSKAWKDPDKKTKIESLLQEIEGLLAED